MADNNTVARPYAQAAFDVAQQSNAIGEVHASLVVARELMGDGRVAKFLGLPSLTDKQRLSFLQGLFVEAEGADSVFGGRSEHGTNFLKILLENDRVGVLPEIADHFEALKAEVENTVDATITSAAPLSEGRQAEIAKVLADRLGRKVRIEVEIDETLIGGAVIRAGDVVIDGSLQARLEGLANALIK